MNKIIRNINVIFKLIPQWNNNDTKLRKRKLTNIDAVKFRFLYSKINTTKQSITSSINYDNGYTANRTSFNRKENNISLDLYLQILNKIRNCYNDNFNKSGILILGIDGSFNNTPNENDKNTLNTSLNMGYYDTLNDIPYDLNYIGPNKKNTELEHLKKYIEDNNLKDVIIVADRAYFKYEFFEYLNSRNIKYVIRIKDNSHLINDIKKTNKNYTLIEKLKSSNRFIKCDYKTNKVYYSKKSDTLSVTKNTTYNLITNIPFNDEYNDERIKEIYNSRWKVETFFKFIKSNFKFSYMCEKKESQYKKLIAIELILTYLVKIIKSHYLSTINKSNKRTKKDGKEVTITNTVNETNIVNGIYDKLIDPLIEGRLTKHILNKFIECYLVDVNNEINRTFQRKCKIPFKKWYIKMYHDIYKYKKIKKYLETDDLNKLDKNLKLIASNIKIE